MSDAEFQGKSHEELYAMVADAKPERLSDVGKALKTAFGDLDRISRDLKGHVAQVKLEGEGGDAFRKWGEQTVMQTTKLAHYVSSAGAVMDKAAEGLTKAQSSMPKPSGSVCFTDAEKERARLKAAETDRQHAVDAMRLLDSYYATAQTDLGKLEEPKFALPPDFNPPSEGWERPYGTPPPTGMVGDGTGRRGSGGSVPSAVADSSGTAPSAPGAHETTYASAHPATSGVPTGAHGADWASGTNIDSTTTLPSSRASVPAPDAIQGHGSAPVPQGPGGPLPVLPRLPIDSRGSGGSEVARGGPDLGRPATAMAVPRGASGPRANDGIVGGLPAGPRGEAAAPRLPRGTVVGEERGSMSRGPVGSGGHSGPVGGPPGAQGMGTGRRLVSEPGGVVGGPRGSIVGRTTGARAEFTPGGSGLVRGTQVPGAVPHMGSAPPGAARRASAGRPAYLTEDAATWTSGRRDTVPPVIE